MTFVWLTTSFDSYLLMFLVATFKNEYASGIGLGVADVVAFAIAGYVYQRVGVRISLIGTYILATVSGFILLTYGLKHEESWVFVLLVFAARFGISFAFNIIYVAHAPLFPTLFSATAFGFCNFFSRIFSAFSSLFAALEEPTPMIIYTTLAGITAVLAFGIQPNPENKNK